MKKAFIGPKIPSFELLTTIGSGGMGEVYLARRHGAYGFERLLAVKVIHSQRKEDSGLRAMFLDEAKLLARMDHPAIAQVFDFGETEDELYLVMEYVAGMSFDELIQHEVKLSPLIAASIVAQVCRGLHYAHELSDSEGRSLNVVHRDVTPANLVLTYGGAVKILDFGIALMRARTAPITHVGFVRGKPTYLAPEQFEGDPVDRRTDIYGVSIVLHELLTRTKLFTDLHRPQAEGSQEQPMWGTLATEVQPPSVTAGPLPAGLDDVVMKGLEESPDKRFQTAREMAMALEAIVERDGAEPLSAFVDRVLAPYRQSHLEQLRALSGGKSSTQTPQPTVGPITQIEESDEPREPELRTEPMMLPAESPNRSHITEPIEALPRATEEPKTLITDATERYTRPGPSIFVGLAIVALAVMAGLFIRSSGQDDAEAKSKEARAEVHTNPPPAPPHQEALGAVADRQPDEDVPKTAQTPDAGEKSQPEEEPVKEPPRKPKARPERKPQKPREVPKPKPKRKPKPPRQDGIIRTW